MSRLKKFISKKNGFTLVEVIVALTILATVLVPVSMMFMTSIKLSKMSGDQMQASQAIKLAQINAKSYISSDGHITNSAQIPFTDFIDFGKDLQGDNQFTMHLSDTAGPGTLKLVTVRRKAYTGSIDYVTVAAFYIDTRQ